jgi:hypothetical protein
VARQQSRTDYPILALRNTNIAIPAMSFLLKQYVTGIKGNLMQGKGCGGFIYPTKHDNHISYDFYC